MAIEFNCPYCTATVKVGAAAAGKIGRCPKCDTRLRIPGIPTQASPDSGTIPATPPAMITPTPPIPPAASSPPQEVPSAFPDLNAPPPAKNPGQLPVVPVTEDPVTSKYLKRRKKKKTNWAGLIPPIIFGGIFVAVGLYYYFQTLPSFEGVLEAERMNPNQNIQVELDGTAFNIDNKTFSQIVDELRQRPSAVRSNLVNLRFRAGAEGIEVGLRPGSEADLVKVPVMQLEAVAKYYKNHFDELDDARLNEMQAALIKLCTDWANAPESKKNDTLPEYRNSVFYNAFVKGLGRISYALVGNSIYPCVHEDTEGSLYFLVPVGTKSFLIKERSELDITPFFPSDYRIEVTVGRSEMAAPQMTPVDEDDVEASQAADHNETVAARQ